MRNSEKKAKEVERCQREIEEFMSCAEHEEGEILNRLLYPLDRTNRFSIDGKPMTWLAGHIRLKAGSFLRANVDYRSGVDFKTVQTDVIGEIALAMYQVLTDLKRNPRKIGAKWYFYLERAVENKVTDMQKAHLAQKREIERRTVLLGEIEAEWPIPPFMWQCEKAVDSLAKIHAKYWDHQYLEELEQYLVDQSLFKINSTCLDSFRLSFFDKKQNEDLLKYHVSQTQSMYQEFKNYLGDRLSKERQYIYEKVIDNLPLILKRTTKKLNVTLIHGDAHLWNFLYPLDNREYCRLVDWQTWDVNIGTEDLSHMIALHWFPKRRALYEGRLIRRYHEQLIINGVKTYSLDDLWNDYRLSVIRKIFLPIRQWYSSEISPQVWWNHLERIFLAFDDLNCLMRLEQRD
ncbi:phosphotransferase [Laceyella tengchongensis]|uniref:phosphotransferase n=1 Tax=Laceyella tengchongensis TaxID=574699 RepID=UPI0012B7CC0F|nr:phosphotransferase [Laceyella tengchongensis]